MATNCDIHTIKETLAAHLQTCNAITSGVLYPMALNNRIFSQKLTALTNNLAYEGGIYRITAR